MSKELLLLYLKKQLFLIIAIVFIVAYYLSARTLQDQATVFPRLLLWVVVPIVLWNMAGSYFELKRELVEEQAAKDQAITGEFDEAKGSDPKGIKKLVGLGFILGYIVIIPYLGFFTATAVYLCGFAYFLGIRNIPRLLAYVAAIDLFAWVIFVYWLEIRFPQGILY